MIIENIGKLSVKRHDDISELLVKNYNLFNKFALYDSETGHTMEDVEKHFQKTDSFLFSGKLDDAVQARKNLHQVFYHIFQENNFPALQWCSLLHSIDEQPVVDYSETNLKLLIEKLSANGLTQKKVKADVEEAKKKFGWNFNFASRKNSTTPV